MKKKIKLYLQIFCLSFVLVFTQHFISLAQTHQDAFSQLMNKNISELNRLEKEINALDEKFSVSKDDAITLKYISEQADILNQKIINIALGFREPLNDYNLRLDQLGDTAAIDEDKTITNQRNTIRQNKAKINGFMDSVEEDYIRINQLIEKIGLEERAIFTKNLTQRVFFTPSHFKEMIKWGRDAFFQYKVLLSDWWTLVFKEKKFALLFSVLFPLLVTLLLFYLAIDFLKRLRKGVAIGKDKVSYLTRFSVAFISSLIPTIISICFSFTSFWFLHFFGLLDTPLRPAFYAIADSLYMVFFITWMSYVILSPNDPKIRLLNMAGDVSWRFVILLSLLTVFIAIDFFFSVALRIVSAPILLSLAVSLICVIIIGVILIAIARLRRHDGQKKISIWPFYIRIPIYFMGLFLIITSLLGYIGLSRYVAQQIVVIGSYLVLIYLGFEMARFLANEEEFAKTSFGKNLQKRYKFKEGTMDQIGLVASIFVVLLVVIACVPPIAVQLGFSFEQIFALILGILTGFQIGNVNISFVNILTGVAVFLFSWFLFNWFVSWLDGTVLKRGRVDEGVRNSISTIIGYLGIAASLLIGLSAAGFNLSSLALIAGGLSLGIGFGMQNIVQNFVSGLILLAERPFKVGDYIETGSTIGYVKRISVRATEVETSDLETIIVPNSNLINNEVGNWTHRNKEGRVEITFTLPALAEPKQIILVIKETARKNKDVLKEPEPYVDFTGFDADVLNFTLSVFVLDITDTTIISNEIRFAIYKQFSDEGMI